MIEDPRDHQGLPDQLYVVSWHTFIFNFLLYREPKEMLGLRDHLETQVHLDHREYKANVEQPALQEIQ